MNENHIIILAIPVIIIVVALLIKLFQWLWNITMPDVFGLKDITYWQAFRILIIAGFLFGGTSASWNNGNCDCEKEASTNVVQPTS